MFGSIGFPELIMIFIVALLLFGPRKLPEIGKTLGKAMNEFRRASNDLQRSLEEEVAADELKAAKREIQDATTLTPPAGPGAAGHEAEPRPAETRPQPTEPK
jgi:Tat protein translocase TatB subunit